jgi:hypothetical protein
MDDLSKIIIGLISFNALIFQLVGSIRKRKLNLIKIHNEFGEIDNYFKIVVKNFTDFSNCVVWFFILINLLLISIGISKLYINLDPFYSINIYLQNKPIILNFLKNLFNLSFFFQAIYAGLVVVIQLQALKIFFNYFICQNNIGNINSRWFVDHEEKPFAIVFNESKALIASSSFCDYFLNINQRSFSEFLSISEFQKIDKDSLGNALFLKTIIEDCVYSLYPKGGNELIKSHKFIDYLLSQPEKPFSSEVIKEFGKSKADYFDFLINIYKKNNRPVPIIPNNAYLRDSVNNFILLLCMNTTNGSIRSLARFLNIFPYNEKVLLKRLSRIKQLNNSSIDLFLKLSIRFRVWPEIGFKKFPFPYSSGVAKFFLNSNIMDCLSDMDIIDQNSNDFRNLFVIAENNFVDRVYDGLLKFHKDPRLIKIIKRTKNIEDFDEISKIEVYDLIDYVLWNHCSRNFCISFPKNLKKNSSNLCPLKLNSSSTTCLCELESDFWVGSGSNFIRKS